MVNIQKNILLSPFTTICLGGYAKHFCECSSESDIIKCIQFARSKKLKIFILGGGSNTVFSDSGFDGLVIKIALQGIEIQDEMKKNVIVSAEAGVDWDEFVDFCVSKNLQGVECLSGIPGSVGAVPVQNVGAYGQEVKDTLIYVRAIDVKTLKPVVLGDDDCRFSYRSSRFKMEDRDNFIITSVMFRLNRRTEPDVTYPELKEKIDSYAQFGKLSISKRLNIVRDTVMEIRRSKGMVIDENDADTRSCGSFFVNPVLSAADFRNFRNLPAVAGKDFPHYESEGSYKIPAAWLIENAGFTKGYKKGGVGISSKHSLALINIKGKSKEIKALSADIEAAVYKKFGIKLEKEPVFV